MLYEVITVLLVLVVNSALWFWTSWMLPRRKVPWRVVLVPSVIAAALFEILKFIVITSYSIHYTKLYDLQP